MFKKIFSRILFERTIAVLNDGNRSDRRLAQRLNGGTKPTKR